MKLEGMTATTANIYWAHTLCIRPCSENFCMNPSFSPYNNAIRYILLFSSFYGWRNWGTQVVNSRAGIQTWAAWLQTEREGEGQTGLQGRGKCHATVWGGGKEQGHLGNWKWLGVGTEVQRWLGSLCRLEEKPEAGDFWSVWLLLPNSS